MKRSGSLLVLPLAALCCHCGSAASAPPSPAPTVTFNGVVFYDQNGNGQADDDEGVRFQGVTVTANSLSGTSGAGGNVAIPDVPYGMIPVSVDADSLPPYYTMDKPITVQVPQETGNPVGIPIELPIGTNTPNVYMAFGDSITVGDGSSDGTGYRGPLQQQLQAYFGAAVIDDQGIEATRSNAGAARIESSLQQTTPAFVLIHYGTNDWNEHDCQADPPCYTITSLQSMVEQAKAFNTNPFLATIIPVNVGYDARVPPQRETWVHNQDALIRQMAAQEGVVLVDLEAAFLQAFADNGGNYQVYFDDHVHPSDLGYALMAKTFFTAITKRAAPSTTSSVDPFGYQSLTQDKPDVR